MIRAASLSLLLALALGAAACADDDEGQGRRDPGAQSRFKPLSVSSCSRVFYDGEGEPRYLIVSDLPLQGAPRIQGVPMSRAIRLVLAERQFRAGRYAIGYQSCDDATAQADGTDPKRCAANARAYAANRSVIGVIGPYESLCAPALLPPLNRAPDGPLGVVSPTSTYAGLTHGGPGTEPGEPDKYYPSGERNFIRLRARDDYQGAANALLARRLGVERAFVIDDREPYGEGLASTFRSSAEKLGVAIAGTGAWDPQASSYADLVSEVRRSEADGVFLAGLMNLNGDQLLRELRSAFGASVEVVTPDGFYLDPAEFVSKIGSGAEGVTVSLPGPPIERLEALSPEFVERFMKETGAKPNGDTFAAAQAAEVLLDAIATSDGTRASATRNLFKTRVRNGLIGSFAITPEGDTTAGAVTIYRVKRGDFRTFAVITPPSDLVSGE
jgi:branched-chain amino acid transport system substrate-binding protein